jgi:ParB family chromosome partitioning protein
MGKRDELLRSAGNVRASVGERGPEFPAGLDPATAAAMPRRLEGVSRDKAAALIAVDRIVRDENQPREDFDGEALERLADSLRERGQLQPVRVRWDEARGVYIVLVGERRWRAAKLAGMAELSCVIEPGDLTAPQRLAVQLVENALREDLKPVEQARAYRALMEANGWSGNRLAKELRVSQSAASRVLALLDLPAPAQAAVDSGAVPPAAAAEILKAPGPAQQAALAEWVARDGATAREVAEVVRAVRARRPPPAREVRPDPVTLDLGGETVTVKWRKATGRSAAAVLKAALRELQAKEQGAA